MAGRSNKKVQKTKSIYFRILLLGGPVNWSPTHSTGPQPIQLVPKNCFYRNLSIGRSNQKNSKNLVHLYSNFDLCRTIQLVPNPFNWSPTHSTGPQKLFFTEISVSVAEIKKIKKTKFIYFRILIQGGPVNWSPTHSTGLQPIP